MTQRQSRSASYFTQPVPTWMSRAVGYVVLVIGLLLLGLSLLGFFRWLMVGRATSSREGLAIAAVLVSMIGLLCTLVGKRLVTGRSPHDDSLLSRAVWTLVGIGFVAMGAGFAISQPWNSDLGFFVLSSAFLATGCFGVAFRPGWRRSP